MNYVAEQVRLGRADWVDWQNPERGIVCRELLYFGAPQNEPEPDTSINWAELPGVRYLPAKMEKNQTLPRIILESLSSAAPGWDWENG